MKILITGANGYIGRRLIPVLLEQGHELFCCVRDKARFDWHQRHEHLHTLELDFLKAERPAEFPKDLDVAFYLIHSMNSVIGDFAAPERQSAKRFCELLEPTRCRQVVYLSGIVNEKKLSTHLSSRLAVEQILRSGRIPCTVLRAGIVVGSGSASFEIIRDLVEKLPVMIAPGDALDFWRVLVADKQTKRLLLFAEMRLPGEAWLEFQVVPTKDGDQLIQTATFRPRGVFGRLYWYAVLPLHHFVFNGMINALTRPD